MKITPAQLKQYMDGKRHELYKETVEKAKELKVHSDPDKDKLPDIITGRRPGEDLTIQQYRKEIFVSITKEAITSVLTSLKKISKTSDWNIYFDEKNKVRGKIREGERLDDYTKVNYPYFTSLESWMFSLGLYHYLVESNGVFAVLPLNTSPQPNEYLQPFVFSFRAEQVYDIKENKYCVIYADEKSTYSMGDGVKAYDGDVYYIFTDESFQRWDQVDADKTMKLVIDYTHGLGMMPAFKCRGIAKKIVNKHILYDSRISPMVPRLNEAAREYTDMQAEVVQHIHSTMWRYSSQVCHVCNGSGNMIVQQGVNAGKTIQCNNTKCEQGYVKISPYEHQILRPPLPGEAQAPIPPMGYVQKNIDIVKIQDDRINEHVFKALSSINFQFSAQVPLNISGKAKEVDRDELNVFVNSIAEDVVWILNKIFYFTNEYRNKITVPSVKDRLTLLPKIAVPEKFDLLNPDYLIEEIDKAKKGGLNPVITTALEQEYASKKFTQNDTIGKTLRLSLLLDPFSAVQAADLSLKYADGTISKIDYIISNYIHKFVKRAMLENQADNSGKLAFEDMDFDTQEKIIKVYAQEVIDQLSVKTGVMKTVKIVNAA